MFFIIFYLDHFDRKDDFDTLGISNNTIEAKTNCKSETFGAERKIEVFIFYQLKHFQNYHDGS